jgi:ABC-type multidrug transport system ATPase subunit
VGVRALVDEARRLPRRVESILSARNIEQTINPFSLDSVLRILHTLLLAREGGFLLHASSAIRNGSAFLFSGVSGAGKTTMARLAPPDVVC